MISASEVTCLCPKTSNPIYPPLSAQVGAGSNSLALLSTSSTGGHRRLSVSRSQQRKSQEWKSVSSWCPESRWICCSSCHNDIPLLHCCLVMNRFVDDTILPGIHWGFWWSSHGSLEANQEPSYWSHGPVEILVIFAGQRTEKAVENSPFDSWVTYEKLWFPMALYVKLPDGNMMNVW